eukprot:4799555-Prymnesium_polylepis.1
MARYRQLYSLSGNMCPDVSHAVTPRPLTARPRASDDVLRLARAQAPARTSTPQKRTRTTKH